MKTTMITKAMMAVVFAIASVWTVNAAQPVKVTNVEMDNDRVAAKVVYEQNGNFLTPEYRFEFKYNDEGRITEKKGMKWDGSHWANYYCMTVTYTDAEAHIDYSLWNEAKKEFVPTQKYVYSVDEAGRFLALHSYRKNQAGWQLSEVISSEVLLANR